MRWLAGGLAALVLLLAIALGVGLVWLSRTLDGVELRERVDRDAERLLGRSVGFERLGFALLPPALVVSKPYVAGENPRERNFLEAREVSLRIALLPLLERSVVIERLRIEDAVVRLVRTPTGLVLPAPAEEQADTDADSGLEVSLRRVELEDAVLQFEDRLFSPPLGWSLDDVDVVIRARARDEPMDLEVQVESDGGLLDLSGTGVLGHGVDLRVAFDRFPLSPLQEALPSSFQLAGRVSGTASVRGRVEAPEELRAELVLREVEGRVGRLAFSGDLRLAGDLEGRIVAPRGSFELDSTHTEIRWGDVLTKRAGVLHELSGRYHKEEGEPLRFDGEMRLRDGRYGARVEVAERVRVSLSSGAFELESWHPMLNLLAEAELSGRVLAEDVEILTNPLEIRGASRFEDVSAALPSGGALLIRGELRGEGKVVRSHDLVVTGETGSVPVTLELEDLGREWTFHTTARASGLEANVLLTNVAGRPDLLHGPVAFEADLRGQLAGETSIREALSGRVTFRIAPGRLRGISIFEATFRGHDDEKASGFFRKLKLKSLSVPLASSLERYYGNSFDSMSATLQIRTGVATTSDFRLATPFYSFGMKGQIRLEDLALDARGQLELGKEVVGAIAGSAGIPGIFPGLTIPLPAIRGTLTNPQPQADWGHFWRTLVGNLPGVRLLRRMGEKLPSF